MEKEKTLLEELGLDKLSEAEKENLNLRLSEMLQERLSDRLLELLTDAEKAEFDKLIEKGDQDKINDFLGKSVPGIEGIVEDEYQKLKTELIHQNERLKDLISKAK